MVHLSTHSTCFSLEIRGLCICDITFKVSGRLLKDIASNEWNSVNCVKMRIIYNLCKYVQIRFASIQHLDVL